MLVVCNGMPRSASTWSYNVVRELLQRTQPTAEVYGTYDEDIAHFLQCIPPAATHAVLKCHRFDAGSTALGRWADAKVLYTWRDPADAVVSCMRMFGYDFEQSFAAIDASLQLFQIHRQSPSALILDYEQIVHSATDAVGRIGAFLEIDCASDTVAAIAERMSLERMRQTTQSLGDKKMNDYAGLAHDPHTLLHRGHIRDGGIGYGRKALTEAQARQIDTLIQRRGLPARDAAQSPA